MTQNVFPQNKPWAVAPRQILKQEAIERDFALRAFLFILLHIPLVTLFRWHSIFPTIHALGTLGIGLLFLLQDQTPKRVIYVLAYIMGSELIWRGTEAWVFYEFGKYASVLLLILGILKFQLVDEAVKWPIVYFALLVPSIFILPRFDREAISFNLAGPLAMALAIMFFSRIALDRDHLRRILFALVAPAVGLATLAVLGIFETEVIEFANASNFETSAGIGPNQISSMMGLGAVAGVMLVLLGNERTWIRMFLIGVSLWLLGQTMLTFSRGGFWNALIALAALGFYLFPQPRARTTFILTTLVLALVGYFVLFPALDDFTENTLATRFQNFEATGRLEIIRADWITFLQHPTFGVGPNQSEQFHALTFRFSSAHTEYSRLLAEHGVLGLIALLVLVFHSSRRFFLKAPPWSKALAASMTVWGLAFMFHAATRLVAPSLLIGLASARFLIGDFLPHGEIRISGSGRHQ